MKLKIKLSLLICILNTILSSGFSQSSIQKIADPWIINTRLGFVYESPGIMKESHMDDSNNDDYIVKSHYFSYGNGDFVIINMIMDTKFESFDPQVGLYGAINNIVSNFKGKQISLSYSNKFQPGINKECNGTFISKGKKYIVRGFTYFNSKKRVYTVIAIGPNNVDTISKFNRIFSSIQIGIK